MYRDHTKEIQIGDRKIGGGNPVLIQSMCNTKTENVAATIEQIHRLEDAGCDIIRVAVPTMEAAAAIREIKKQIHFRWLPTFTLTTAWLSQLSRAERIRSASTRATSGRESG